MARDYGHSSHVCVCNSSYCDTYPPVQAVPGAVLQVGILGHNSLILWCRSCQIGPSSGWRSSSWTGRERGMIKPWGSLSPSTGTSLSLFSLVFLKNENLIYLTIL